MTYRTHDLDDVARELAGAGVDAEVRDGVLWVFGFGEEWVRARAWPVLQRWRGVVGEQLVTKVGGRAD